MAEINTIPALQEQVKKLLKKNLFIKQVQQQKIIDDIPTLSETKLQQIIEKLQKGYESQKIVLKALLKKNPNLLTNLKTSIKNKETRKRQDNEAVSVQEETSIIEDLESEFENL